MNCPQCKNYMADNSSKCDCGFDFRRCTWVTIVKTASPYDIIIESLLKSYGIPVKVLRSEVSQIPVSIGPLAEVKIAVPEPMAEEAKGLLESNHIPDLE